MKIIVKMAVLLATLLLLSGSAFAFCWPPDSVGCWRVNATDQENPEASCTRDVVILAKFENQCGILFAPPDSYPLSLMFLSMYFDEMKQKMSGGLLGFDSLSIKFHGDYGYVFTGELSSLFLPFCGGPTGHYRYKVKGTMLDEGCGSITADLDAIGTLVNNTATLLNQTGATFKSQTQ